MNLVEHAKLELKLAGIEPEYVGPILDMVRIFADMGHSGTSAEITATIVKDLLDYKNLIPLTDNPEEWTHHGAEIWGEKGGIWQNVRNARAFSRDGGKHYWLLEDRPGQKTDKELHTSVTWRGR